MSSKAVGNVNIRVTSNTSNFQRGMRRAEKSAGMFEKSLGTAKKAIIGFGAAITARAVFRVGATMVRAAMEQERAETKLAAAFRSRGIQSEWALERMKRYASELQKVTVYGDEVILSQAAMMASMTGLSGDSLERATKAAIGLSAAYGIELAAAFRLVARARVGDTAQLKRYGIIVDQTKSKLEQFNQVVLAGAKGFSIAAAEAKTASGQMRSLGNLYGDVKEKIGTNIMAPARGGGVGKVRGALEAVDNFLAEPSSGVIPYARDMRGSPEERLRQLRVELKKTSGEYLAAANAWADVEEGWRSPVTRSVARLKPLHTLDALGAKLTIMQNNVFALEQAIKQGQGWRYIGEADPNIGEPYRKAIKWATDYAKATAKIASAYGGRKMQAAENWLWRLEKHGRSAFAAGAQKAVSVWEDLKKGISESVKELIRYNAEDAKQKALAKATAKRRLAERRSFAESVRTSTRTPLEEYKERMAELKKSRLAGDIDFETYRRAALQAKLDLASGAQQAGGVASSSSLVGQAQKVQDAALNKQADLSRRQLSELEAIKQILGGTLTVDGGFVAMGV